VTELEEKIARLPVWAREHIKHLQIRNEPLVQEAARCRQIAERAETKAKRLSEANAALLELLNKAGQADLDWAKTVVDVLDGYEIFRSPDKEANK
jgi:hypothetical protein